MPQKDFPEEEEPDLKERLRVIKNDNLRIAVETVSEYLSSMSPRRARILSLYLGLSDGRCRTIKEISGQVKAPESAVIRFLASILRQLYR